MNNRVEIKGFEEFDNYTNNIDPDGPPVLFYFSGTKSADGKSWCPDCVEDKKTLKKAPHKPKVNAPWFDAECAAAVMARKRAEKNYSVAMTKENFFKYKEIAAETRRLLKKKKHLGLAKLTEPVVQAYLNELEKNIIFAYVDVGDMPYWKDKACPFRTDARTRLMVIPTIIKWNGVQRLEGSQCNKRDLLQMLFEDEE